MILYWTIRAFSKILILSRFKLICINMKIWIYMSLNRVIQNRSDGSSSIHIQKLCAKFEPIWSSRTTQVPPSGNQGGTAFPSMKFPVSMNEIFIIFLLHHRINLQHANCFKQSWTWSWFSKLQFWKRWFTSCRIIVSFLKKDEQKFFHQIHEDKYFIFFESSL